YHRALAEFPDDAAAHGGLALALEQSGRLDLALGEYKAWSRLQPGDPLPLNRTGAVCEHLGKPTEAATAYLAAAEVYRDSKQLSLAIDVLRHAVALDPERALTHEKLAASLGKPAKILQPRRNFWRLRA
ncbi:MAG: tetratricopeptide repeat protein, partial [Rudaea sp.]